SGAPGFSFSAVRNSSHGADGKVVAVGFADFQGQGSGPLIVRFDANGALDTTFAGTGYVQNPGDPAQFNAIAVRPDGRIVAGGGQYVSPSYRFVLAQYLANGAVDFDFGSAGRALLPLSSFNTAYNLYAMTILPDGRMLAAGGGYPGDRSEAYMFRLTAAGALDPGFGGVGYVSISSPDYPAG